MRVSLDDVFTEYFDYLKGRYVPRTFNTWGSYTRELHRFLKNEGIEWVEYDPDPYETEDYHAVLKSGDLYKYLKWVSRYNQGSGGASKYSLVKNFGKELKRSGKTKHDLTDNDDWNAKDMDIDRDDSMRRSDEEGVVKPYLPPEQVKLLWQHAPDPHRFRNQTLIMWLWVTGQRRHEASKARVDDIESVPGKSLMKTKTYSTKTEKKIGDGRNELTINDEQHTVWTIFFSDSIETQLRTYLDVYRPDFNGASESPYLFLTNKSEQMSGNLINEKVKTAAENAGIQHVIGTDAAGRNHYHVTAHTIRHSFATHIANNKNSRVKLNQLGFHLGHQDLSTTQLYVHDNQKERMEAFSGHSPGI